MIESMASTIAGIARIIASSITSSICSRMYIFCNDRSSNSSLFASISMFIKLPIILFIIRTQSK